jgi:serine/threonine protein kinase/Flp pilus assembly protein TadD
MNGIGVMSDSRSPALDSTAFRRHFDVAAAESATIRLQSSSARPIFERPTFHELVEADPAAPSPLPLKDEARYQLLQEIGRGGMGAVFRGFDRELDRELAVKVLLDEHLADADQVERFHREAWIVGQLQHPGIVPLYDAGRFATGQPYFVMRLIEGQTLAALLMRRSSPADDHVRLLKVFESVCQTLAYAHSRGVIHRDLKPANVMVGEFGEVQVMDWGLARARAGAGIEDEPPDTASAASSVTRSVARHSPVNATQAGDVFGTPAYMAPEQARGDAKVDERADVFGLGAILCEILTGKPPYFASAATEAIQQASAGDVAEARQRLLACGADADLVALARDCLAPNPAERPANASEIGRRLQDHLAGVERRAHEADLQRAATAARLREEHKRRRLTLALAIAVLTIAVVGTVGGLVVSHQRTRRAEERTKFQQEKTDRDTDAMRRVMLALDEAEDLRSAARQSPDALPLWARAVAEARHAEPLLTSDLAESDLARRVRRTIAEMERGEQAARDVAADRRILNQIEEARLARTKLKDGRFDMAGAEPAYAAAFREYGIDVEQASQRDASEWLIKRKIRVELSIALADWAITRRSKQGDDDPLASKLVTIAMMIDTNAWRQRFYDALLKHNEAELLALASPEEVDHQPPATIFLLTDDLASRGKQALAGDLLRRSLLKHAGDFWLNHEYAFVRMDGPTANYNDAARYLAAAVAVRPQSPGARLNLACALQNAGDQTSAIEQLREVIRLEPHYADAHYNLGLSLARSGRTRDAIESFQRALAENPSDLRASESLGHAFNELGDHAAAIEACRKTLALDPDNRYATHELSLALQNSGDFAGAETAAKRLVELDPTSPVVHYNLGTILDGAGKRDAAVTAYREAIRLRPDFAEAYCNMGHSLLKTGRNVDAFVALTRGHELGMKRADWRFPSEQWTRQAAAALARDLWPIFAN